MNTLKKTAIAVVTSGLLATAAACGAAETPAQQIGEPAPQAPADPMRTEPPRGIPSAENAGSTGSADDRRWEGTLRGNIPD